MNRTAMNEYDDSSIMKHGYAFTVMLATEFPLTEEQRADIQESLEEHLRLIGSPIPESAGHFGVGEP